MWTVYLVIVLVNLYKTNGRNINTDMYIKVQKPGESSNVHDIVTNTERSYNYFDRPPEHTYTIPTNSYASNTYKYNNARNDNYQNNGVYIVYNGTGFARYRYNTSLANSGYNQLPDYSGNYNYEKNDMYNPDTSTEFNRYSYNNIPVTSSTYYPNYNRYNDMYNPYNRTGFNTNGFNNIPASSSTYNQYSDYNRNYNYENTGMYNPYNNTGYNGYGYYNNAYNGSDYQHHIMTIPKHNTTGFRPDNTYNQNPYNMPGFNNQTPTYVNPNTPVIHNYQDPNQSNFSGYFQQQNTEHPVSTISVTPVSDKTGVSTVKPRSTTVQIACVLCNIGCPTKTHREGLYCVPDDYDY